MPDLFYLDAHEQNPLQPREERSMDLANNRAGILAAERLIEKKQFSIEKQEEAALKEIEEGRLVIINGSDETPRYK